jgi:hypothetical protein
MAETSVVQRALAECWEVEVAGVVYYETLGERFPEHRHEADVLTLVEKTTRDLIAAVAHRYDVLIDHDAAEHAGVEFAKLGGDWREVLESASAVAAHTLQMFENLADVLPKDESALAQAVVEHERAQIVWFESAVAGEPYDWSPIDAYLERHGARRTS